MLAAPTPPGTLTSSLSALPLAALVPVLALHLSTQLPQRRLQELQEAATLIATRTRTATAVTLPTCRLHDPPQPAVGAVAQQ